MTDKPIRIHETEEGGYFALGGKTLIKKFKEDHLPENLKRGAEFLEARFQKRINNLTEDRCFKIIRQAIRKYNLGKDGLNLILEIFEKIIAERNDKEALQATYQAAIEKYIRTETRGSLK